MIHRAFHSSVRIYLGSFRTFIGRCRLCDEPAHVRAVWMYNGDLVVLHLCEDHDPR